LTARAIERVQTSFVSALDDAINYSAADASAKSGFYQLAERSS
jgi:hypothetical protein